MSGWLSDDIERSEKIEVKNRIEIRTKLLDPSIITVIKLLTSNVETCILHTDIRLADIFKAHPRNKENNMEQKEIFAKL